MQEKLRKYLPLVLLAAIAVAVSALCWPAVKWLGQDNNLVLVCDWIRSLGFAGVFAFLALQVGQLVFAIIPGEPFEVIAGMIYGTFGGLTICLLGTLLGAVPIFYAVRRFGRPFVHRFVSEEKLQSYSFFQSAEKLDILIFIMFLIPGTPKDILTYICPLTPVKPLHFFMLSTLAKIPSIVTSTLAGATLSSGNPTATVLILLFTSVVGAAGIMYQRHFTAKLNASKVKVAEVKQRIIERKK